MTKRDLMAFLLGAFVLLMAQRWIALEYSAWKQDIQINAITGFLQRAMR